MLFDNVYPCLYTAKFSEINKKKIKSFVSRISHNNIMFRVMVAHARLGPICTIPSCLYMYSSNIRAHFCVRASLIKFCVHCVDKYCGQEEQILKQSICACELCKDEVLDRTACSCGAGSWTTPVLYRRTTGKHGE